VAVAKINKVELIAHISDKEKIIKALEKVSILEIQTKEETLSPEKVKTHIHNKINHLTEKLSRVNFLLRLVNQISAPKQSLIDSFVPPKLIVKKKDFETILEGYPLDKIYKEMEALDVKFHQSRHNFIEADNNANLLNPWKKLDFNPNETETQKAQIFFATIPDFREEEFIDVLEEECPLCYSQVINRANGLSYLVVYVHKENLDVFNNLIRRYEFILISLPKVIGTVSKTIDDLKKKALHYKEEEGKVINRIKKINRYYSKLVISRSFLENELHKANVENNLTHTSDVFVVEGFIKAADYKKLRSAVAEQTNKYALTFEDVKAKDKPPVILENPRYLKPLEAVTALYGMPSYDELDPTPYLAPFFLIAFGLAIGDVIYGLALIGLSWLLTKSKRFSPNTKVFLGLFIYGGIAATFFGVITGSWLTFPHESLPRALQSIVLFDPIAQPALFLVITLLFGLVQIYLGVILKLVGIARDKSVSKALQSQLPILLLIPGVAILIAGFLGFPLSPIVYNIAVYLALAGILGVIIFSEYEAKSIVGRIGGGLYNLYSMTSYLGDTISYGRIMALGLATFLIGSTINTMFLGNVLFQSLLVKIVLGISLVPILHLLNLAVNTISAFVHPARLQYVEFFSKFFKGGGSRFQPIALKTDNIIIE